MEDTIAGNIVSLQRIYFVFTGRQNGRISDAEEEEQNLVVEIVMERNNCRRVPRKSRISFNFELSRGRSLEPGADNAGQEETFPKNNGNS